MNLSELIPRNWCWYDFILFSKCTFCKQSHQSNHELDFHYWKNCPFLTKCLHCHDIVKISDLNSHLLSSFETLFDDSDHMGFMMFFNFR